MVLLDSVRLLQAVVDVISSNGWLKPALEAMELSQMMVQGVWAKDSYLRQIPHFSPEVVLVRPSCRHRDVDVVAQGMQYCRIKINTCSTIRMRVFLIPLHSSSPRLHPVLFFRLFFSCTTRCPPPRLVHASITSRCFYRDHRVMLPFPSSVDRSVCPLPPPKTNKQRCEGAGVETPFDIMGLEDDERDRLLDMPQSKMADVANFCNAFPNVEMAFEVQESDDITAGDPVSLVVTLERDGEEDEDEPEGGWGKVSNHARVSRRLSVRPTHDNATAYTTADRARSYYGDPFVLQVAIARPKNDPTPSAEAKDSQELSSQVSSIKYQV